MITELKAIKGKLLNQYSCWSRRRRDSSGRSEKRSESTGFCQQTALWVSKPLPVQTGEVKGMYFPQRSRKPKQRKAYN